MSKTKDLVSNNEFIQDLLAMTGESNQAPRNPFIPTFEVNNAQNEKEVEIEGKKQIVKLDPEKLFMLTEQNENGEYIKTSGVPSIEGVIIKIRYSLSKKYSEQDKSPFFYSPEFDTFFENVTLISNKEEIFTSSYKKFKEEYAERYILWLIAYILVDDTVYKLKVKGSSRGAIWDYIKKTRGEGGHLVTQKTLFGIETNTEKQLHYNVMTIDKVENGKVDLQKCSDVLKGLTFYDRAAKVGQLMPREDIETIDAEVAFD